MKILEQSINTIEAYIQVQEKEKQAGLIQLLAIIKKAAPKATEGISYHMPVLKQEGVLVYFSAAKNHFGFYPTAKPIAVFKKQLDALGLLYSKGAIQLPLNKPFPTKLIQEIVRFRIQENEMKTLLKNKKNTKK
jgi:uncharacterized protein YdhG (YjbR/CyaY superfamily)